MDPAFPNNLIESGDIPVLLTSLSIFISQFQRYPKSSQKLKKKFPNRTYLLGIYCLNFSSPLSSKRSSLVLMNIEGV